MLTLANKQAHVTRLILFWRYNYDRIYIYKHFIHSVEEFNSGVSNIPCQLKSYRVPVSVSQTNNNWCDHSLKALVTAYLSFYVSDKMQGKLM